MSRRIEVFADITCPFTHVGLRRFVAVVLVPVLVTSMLRVKQFGQLFAQAVSLLVAEHR